MNEPTNFSRGEPRVIDHDKSPKETTHSIFYISPLRKRGLFSDCHTDLIGQTLIMSDTLSVFL